MGRVKRAFLADSMRSPDLEPDGDYGYENYLKNEKARLLKLEVRNEMIASYGGKCVCCGESNEAFLMIHHVLGNGKQHRSIGVIKTWREIIAEPDRSKYLLLCFNCHSAGHSTEGCPHKNGVKLRRTSP